MPTIKITRIDLYDRSEIKLVADCHGTTEVNLITTLDFYTRTSSIESLKRLEGALELVTALSAEAFPGAVQTEEKIKVGEKLSKT